MIRSKTMGLFAQVASWENLLDALHKAARGKRGRPAAATFEHLVADRLLDLQQELLALRYRPGPYVHFIIHSPKLRKISAAPFRDRVVHHALCNVIEPMFERRFIVDSYANRVGKGTHRAVDRLQDFARRYRYVLRLDIVKHFPSVDHVVLRRTLARVIPDDDVMWLAATILASGEGVLEDQAPLAEIPGVIGPGVGRPRGLPIGNLTSQFWSNCYMDPFDHFVKRDLRCPAYLRYVDDFALFGDSKQELWAWKRSIVDRLAGMKLTIHEESAQVVPVAAGIPWLGFVVFPTHRRVKARNARSFTRRFASRWRDYCAARITFAEFRATLRGWVDHVRYADTWGLRRHVLGRPLVRHDPEGPPPCSPQRLEEQPRLTYTVLESITERVVAEGLRGEPAP